MRLRPCPLPAARNRRSAVARCVYGARSPASAARGQDEYCYGLWDLQLTARIPEPCKTGGFQGVKDRHLNGLQMFGPRFIMVASGQEPKKHQETLLHSRSSPQLDPGLF
jgi:hypothetical protein